MSIIINMEQTSVNQRIKFLIEQMGISARAFSEAISESPTNTHNYIGKRNSMPGADYLEKITIHFENVNPIWLLTGQGEPFLSATPNSTLPSTNAKNFSNSVLGNNNSAVGQENKIDNSSTDHQKDIAALQKEVALLTSQLADKERTIQILLKQQP